MPTRQLPSGYGRSDGRLISYSVGFGPQIERTQGDWLLRLDKEYIPHRQWDEIVAEGLDKYGDRTTAADEILRRLDFERTERLDTWRITAHTRSLSRFPAAARDIFERQMLPLLRDETDTFWPQLKGMLIDAVRAEGLDYARLAEPAYLVDHLDDARTVWGLVECVAHVGAAKWELGVGACRTQPSPEDFHYPDTGKDLEMAAWYARRFGREEGTVDDMVTRHQNQFTVPDSFHSIQELANEYGPQAAELVFGELWEDRFGYEALLCDLERDLASRDELIALAWIWNLRVRR